MSKTIQGTWWFSSLEPTTPSTTIIEHVKFTCGNGDCSHPHHTTMTAESVTLDGGLILTYDNAHVVENVKETAYDSYNSAGWLDHGYRKITFDGEQTVSDEFYAWFTSNAEECVPISGAWTFEFSATGYTGPDDAVPLIAVADFKSNYESFTGFTLMGTCLYYDGSPSGTACVYDNSSQTGDGWFNANYRTIDFGTSIQYIPESAYTWIIDNAKFSSTIAGVWTFNDTLTGPIPDQDEYEKFPVSFKVGSKSFTGITYQDPQATNARLFFDDIPVYDFTTSKWIGDDVYKTVNFGAYAIPKRYSFWTWLCHNATRHESLSGIWRINDTLKGTGISGIEVSAYLGHIYDVETLDITIVHFYADQNTATISDVVETFHDRRINFGAEEQGVTPEFYAWFVENATNGTSISGNWRLNETLLPPEAAVIEQNFEFYGYAFGHGMLYKPAYLKIERVSSGDSVTPDITFTCYGYTATGETFADTALYNRILGFGPTDQTVSFEFYDWLVDNAEIYAAVNGTWTLKDEFELPAEDFTESLYLYGKYRFGEEWVQDPGVKYPVAIVGTSNSVTLIAENVGSTYLYVDGVYDLDCLVDNKLNFGEDLQEVSSAFYNWFYANAVFVEDAIEEIYQIKGSTLRAIAGSIRDRAGLVGEIVPTDMPVLIRNIPSTSEYKYAEEVSV